VSVAPVADGPPRTRSTSDLVAVLVAALVVVAAAVVGRALRAAGVDIFLPFPPLLAEWLPHAGPGTPVAVAVAVLVVARARNWRCGCGGRRWWGSATSRGGRRRLCSAPEDGDSERRTHPRRRR
jgi:hypothetical protein